MATGTNGWNPGIAHPAIPRAVFSPPSAFRAVAEENDPRPLYRRMAYYKLEPYRIFQLLTPYDRIIPAVVEPFAVVVARFFFCQEGRACLITPGPGSSLSDAVRYM